VTDTGRGQPAGVAAGPSGGHGLAGMRERAATVGGTVETEPAYGGGFQVAARLPVGGQLADPARAQDVEGGPAVDGARDVEGGRDVEGARTAEGARAGDGARP
jgi:hypothetical protein